MGIAPLVGHYANAICTLHRQDGTSQVAHWSEGTTHATLHKLSFRADAVANGVAAAAALTTNPYLIVLIDY